MHRYDPEKHRRRSVRLKGYDYAQPGAYFVTICVRERECALGDVVNGHVQMTEYGRIARDYWDQVAIRFPNISIDTFVVMPNHVHAVIVINDPPGRGGVSPPAQGRGGVSPPAQGRGGVSPPAQGRGGVSPPAQGRGGVSPPAQGRGGVSPPAQGRGGVSPPAQGRGTLPLQQAGAVDGKGAVTAPLPIPTQSKIVRPTLGQIVAYYKYQTTKQINQIRDNPGIPFWQRSFYDHIIRNDRELGAIRRYIADNPLKWELDRDNPRNIGTDQRR